MTINDHGFLGKDIENYKKEIVQKWDELFNFYKEINQFLNKLRPNLRPSKSDKQKVAIVTLFNRAIETFQSIYILCSHGLINDAESLNRVLFEAVVSLLYCAEGEDSYKRYIATGLRNKIKSINIIKNNPRAYSKEVFKENLLNSKKSELETILKELGEPPPISIDVMARKTGMGDIYDSFFVVASETIHTSLRVLEDYIVFDEKENIKVMWGPRIEGIDVQLFTAIEFMLSACKGLSEIFGKPQGEEINSLNEKKEGINKKYRERE